MQLSPRHHHSSEDTSKNISKGLGEMSKINVMSIQHETYSRLNRYEHRLSKEVERIIRAEGVHDLIRSKESGHLFRVIDLIKAAGYHPQSSQADKEYWNGTSFIRNLISLGVLRQYKESGFYSSYDIDEKPVLRGKLKYSKKRARKNKKDPRIVEVSVREIMENQANSSQDNGGQENEHDRVNPEVVNDARDVSSDVVCNDYSFDFVLRKRSLSGAGNREIAKVSLDSTSIEKITEVVNNIIKVSKDE